MTRSTRTIVVAAVASVVLACAGCVSEGPPRRPKPRDIPQQPSGLNVDRLVVAASNFPQDTNGNGFYDTIIVTVYLYSDRYMLPIVAEGEMEFRLVGREGAEIASWRLDAGTFAQRVRRFNPGPGYQLRLSLLDSGTDQLPVSEGELWWRFVETGRTPISGRGSTVLLGPTTVRPRG